jgi:hypothetical protein
MSGHRRKPKAITDIATFGDDMTTIAKLLIDYQAGLYTGGDHFRMLQDLHIQLCDVTMKISQQSELPWVARSRGWTWPQ